VSAVSTEDSENSSIRAVTRIAGAAQQAVTASCVDLADDTLTHPGLVLTLLDHANELVADCSLKTGITARDLKIRIANTRQQHANQRLVAALGLIDFAHRDLLLVYS
jgi:hypothetical protein